MIPYFKSAWALGAGVLRRAYFLLFALFLDPVDVYGRFKPDGWPNMPIPDWTFWAAFWVTLGLAVFFTFHEARQKAQKRLQRFTLLELRDYCGKRGWDVSGNGPHAMEILDLADAIRQSAIFDEARLWGRIDKFGNGSMGLTRDEPRTRVPDDHFQSHNLDVIGMVHATDNYDILSYDPGSDGSPSRGGYRDLLIEIPSLKEWEIEARRHFKGRRDRDKRTTQGNDK